MKVIHLISGGDVGGAKTHVHSLLHGLNKEHTAILGCFTEGPFAQEARDLGIPTVVIEGKSLPAAVKELKELVMREGCQIIHCHGAKGNLAGFLLRAQTGLPLVTTVHSDPKLDYMGRRFADLTIGALNRWLLHRVDYMVGVSDCMRDLLISRGFSPSRIYPIYNGVDFENCRAAMSREEYLDSIGLVHDKDSVVYGIAARISPVKDMPTLVRAFGKAAAREKRMKLVIAGDGEDRAKLEALVQEVCPKDSVCFAGWISDTNSFYNALDVNLLTSLSETFPYAITEGARMHCATIASRVGGVPRVVIPGQTGFLFSPGDVETLSKYMLVYAQDPALRSRMSQAIYDKVLKEYAIDVTVQTQIRIYESILRKQRRIPGTKDEVLICGAYGKGNAGDESILEAIIQQLRGQDPDLPICVMSQDPVHTACQTGVDTVPTFSLLKVYRRMKRAKLFISGGGSLIQDATSTRSLLFYLHTIQAAKRRGCKVMLYGCGIGPVSKPANRRLAGKIIDRCADLITLRDPGSVQDLADMGVHEPEIRLTADPALLHDISPECLSDYAEYCRLAGLEPQTQRYCLFALRPWGNVRRHVPAFTAAAEYVWKQYGLIPAFFQLEPGKDRQITMTVAETIHCPKLVLPPLKDGRMICALMRDMKLAVSMRLHALIFASSQGVPVVGISYDPKVSSYMDYLEQENYVPLDQVTDGALCDLIDSALSSESTEQAILTRLRSLADQNGKLAKRLIDGDILT